jgi:hypothetical protein
MAALHSINAIGPAPHWRGRKREHRSIVFNTKFATEAHITSVHKLLSSTFEYLPTHPLTTRSLIRNKAQQLVSCISQ